jgi:Bacterial PH domain
MTADQFMEFNAPMGGQIKFITIGLFAVLLVSLGDVLQVCYSVTGHVRGFVTVLLVFDVLVAAGAVLATLACKIQRYEIQPGKVVVVRFFGRKEIPCDPDDSAIIDNKALTGAIRTLGNGGIFAISGRFQSRELGAFQAFVTDPRRLVVLKTLSGVFVLSPDSPEAFVNYFNSKKSPK